MSVDVGSATGYLDLDITGFLNGLRTAQSEANTSASKLETVGKKFVAVGDKIAGVGTKLTAITAPLGWCSHGCHQILCRHGTGNWRY